MNILSRKNSKIYPIQSEEVIQQETHLAGNSNISVEQSSERVYINKA